MSLSAQVQTLAHTNNHPQVLEIFLTDNNLNPAGRLIGLTEAPPNDWKTSPDLPNSVSIQIMGWSRYKTGDRGGDNGVRISAQYYQKGVMLKMDWDDCGETGSNPDGNFQDKRTYLWLPIVYLTDFKEPVVKPRGFNNGNLLVFE